MKLAYFDCQFGASGDMLLGALLDAGLDERIWLKEIAKIALPPDSYSIKINEVIRRGIAAKKVEVNCTQSSVRAHISHEISHGHTDARYLADIRQIIKQSAISQQAKLLSNRIFTRLANAEARVHGISPEDVHFHEVGAVDAIIDIVGCAIAYELLGIETSYVSRVPLGCGQVLTDHGILPIPSPATLDLLTEAQASILSSDIDFECLTPTGAAILAEIACAWGYQPAWDRIITYGYGAGTKDNLPWPNVLRLIIGEAVTSEPTVTLSDKFSKETIAVVEANLDDCSPQILSYAVGKLLDAGALDVTVLPAVMKKSRSGHVLSVLCKVSDKAQIQELILRETSSIGTRSYLAERMIAKREWQEVKLSTGDLVRIKIARDNSGAIINATPEYNDCENYAALHGIPIKDVIQQALVQFYEEQALAGLPTSRS